LSRKTFTVHPILDDIKRVVIESSNVRTNLERLKEVAQKIAEQPCPQRDYSFYPDLDENDLVQFAFILHSINFQFTEFQKPWRSFKVEYEGGEYNGFFGLVYSLRKALDQNTPILKANYLAYLTEEEARQFLTGKNIAIPMLTERVFILSEIGKVLAEKYDGRFSNLLKLSNKVFNCGKGLVEKIVTTFPSFNDIRIYKPTGNVVRFYKRAQLLLSDLHYNPKCSFELKDIDRLTVFSDYRLPQALRHIGILEYSRELAMKVDSKIPLPEGSDEEVEIRAHTIYASNLLCKEINKYAEKPMTTSMLDFCLWLEAKKSEKPHHLTKTTHY